MKSVRYVLMVLALAIPVTAWATTAGEADCCAKTAPCCQHGCPHCHHAR